ncbi:MAG: class I SAM-dependent rRNA methyltransferase [Bacteroidales bacterium]|jgi:23S rRNA (cytosine1962-C5)-methyltransferase|nr:class I SAM-dependent rRNA methyltransferase [Bacteroidales bacterium]
METKIILKSGKEQSVRRLHPWIFSGAIKKIYGEPSEGDIVRVFGNKDNFLAVGHYQPGSIAVRILSFIDVEPDISFFRQAVLRAWEFRKAAGLTGNSSLNVFRLIHAEGDGLPGLIADYYNGVVVMQMHSVGMYRIRRELAGIIREIPGLQVKAVYDKSGSTIPFMSGIRPDNEFLFGDSEPVTVTEYGFRFKIDWIGGQKTGFFIDQRENRRLLGEYAKDRSVLNMFGYTGGFSVYAMKDARLVHSVDSSAQAVELADENVKLNFGDDPRHTSIKADAFNFLNDIRDKYDLIILDPPAFAKHNNVLSNALQGYKRLNMKAIEMIRPGGVIFTFSCSQVVNRENFRKSVFAAAANTGRSVRILHQMSQPPDHPVNIYHPESEYLKGLVLYVE